MAFTRRFNQVRCIQFILNVTFTATSGLPSKGERKTVRFAMLKIYEPWPSRNGEITAPLSIMRSASVLQVLNHHPSSPRGGCFEALLVMAAPNNPHSSSLLVIYAINSPRVERDRRKPVYGVLSWSLVLGLMTLLMCFCMFVQHV